MRSKDLRMAQGLRRYIDWRRHRLSNLCHSGNTSVSECDQEKHSSCNLGEPPLLSPAERREARRAKTKKHESPDCLGKGQDSRGKRKSLSGFLTNQANPGDPVSRLFRPTLNDQLAGGNRSTAFSHVSGSCKPPWLPACPTALRSAPRRRPYCRSLHPAG